MRTAETNTMSVIWKDIMSSKFGAINFIVQLAEGRRKWWFHRTLSIHYGQAIHEQEKIEIYD